MTKTTLLTVAACLTISSFSQAAVIQPQTVTAKVCDGIAQKPLKNEVVAIVEDQSLLGYGYQLDNGCTIMNFHQYISSVFRILNGVKTETLQVIEQTAIQKNWCVSEIKTVPAQFETAELIGNKLILTGGTRCKKLELTLK